MADANQVRIAALTMIERFGEDALRQIEIRIEELRECGDRKTERLWIEIRRTVVAMTRVRGTKAKH